jgi:hypothetical protein
MKGIELKEIHDTSFATCALLSMGVTRGSSSC